MEKLTILEKITPGIKAEMETIWFTADLHHGHPKIVDICSRPTTIENMNEWLVKEVFNPYNVCGFSKFFRNTS